MMQRFYGESQGRNESIAHYFARLAGKQNEINVKQSNRVYEAETAGYIRDCLFSGLKNPSEWQCMSNLITP